MLFFKPKRGFLMVLGARKVVTSSPSSRRTDTATCSPTSRHPSVPRKQRASVDEEEKQVVFFWRYVL